MKYTIEEIRQMQEGQTFDCKSILIEPKHLATIIVAMANADGGMIAVGISDKTRRIEGVNQDKEHLNDILRCSFGLLCSISFCHYGLCALYGC